ncbi:hypothetical protein DPEC_G00251480 [Dallia pectoralis]|uniref:Uncharacterized protein n=1 Tax=Dallia pectoralis TaxID=75939 RepID=A0ACC2FTD9_DALPE|nr:hypothetical protein DPEC_G00251480 [Dallia pectoralis]
MPSHLGLGHLLLLFPSFYYGSRELLGHMMCVLLLRPVIVSCPRLASPGSSLQGASAEAPASWQLRCSCALVTRIHVAPAAPCLLAAADVGDPRQLDPAKSKVAMGMPDQYQVKTLWV